MDFEHPEERRMLVDSIDRFLDNRYDLGRRNAVAFSDDGWSRQTWQDLAEMGVLAALFPENAGGLAGTGFDISAVFDSLGQRLVVEPLLDALMAGRLLASSGEQEELDRLIAGERVVLPALEEPASRYDLRAVAAEAMPNGERWAISGTKTNVAQAGAGDAFLATARDAAGKLSLFLVEADAPGVSLRDFALIDGGRGADLTLESAPARLVGEPGNAPQAIEAAVSAGLVALSAEAVAIMDAVRDQTLEYLRTRKQFGQPIGQFQALKHRMASLSLEIEQARSAVIFAAAHLEADRLTRERAASSAKFTTSRIGTMVVEEAIQMHGGMGMTWELPLSHYVKRLITIGHLLGDEDHHLDRYIALGREHK